MSPWFKEDALIFGQLRPLLDEEGVSWIMLGSQAVVRPMLLVNMPRSFFGTHLYVARHALFSSPAIYGFSGLFLGMADHPRRVTKRLAWILRHGEMSGN